MQIPCTGQFTKRNLLVNSYCFTAYRESYIVIHIFTVTMSNKDNIRVLNESVKVSQTKFEHDFQKVKYKLYPKILEYSNVMTDFVNNYTFTTSSTINRNGEEFNFFHLTTFTSTRFKHVEHIFNYPNLKIDRLGNDIKFCNKLLSYILFNEMNIVQNGIQTMPNYRLYPIRWTHINKDVKHVFLKIPKGELDFFMHKAQEFNTFSYEWFLKVLKSPVVVYSLGFKKFQISKDGKHLKEGKTELLISKKQIHNLALFESFVVLQSIKKILSILKEDPVMASFFTNLININLDEPFWYFRTESDRSSSTWAQP